MYRDPQKLGEWLLTLYLGTAPVYWLPGISVGGMQVFKFLLVVSACGVVWYEAIQRDHALFPRGLAGLAGAYLVMISLFFGVFRAASMGEIISALKDFTLCFVFLWTLYIFCTRGGNVARVFRNAALLIVLFSVPPIANWFLGIPEWSNIEGYPLWSTGFTNKRTGWSEGVALYVPIVASFPVVTSRRSLTSFALAFVGLLILVGGQFVSGGRGGLLASIVSLLVVSALLLPRKISIPILLAILIGGFTFSDFAYNHLRFDRLTSFSYEALNTFTSYRLEDYVATYELFWRQPLGHGFGNSVQILMEEFQQRTELHNVWLRLLADGGLLLLVSMLSVVGYVLRENLRSLRHDVLWRLRANLAVPNAVRDRQRILVVSLAILLAGLTISMFAPRAPIGAFQNSAVWWAAAGVVVGMSELVRHRQPIVSREVSPSRSRVRPI